MTTPEASHGRTGGSDLRVAEYEAIRALLLTLIQMRHKTVFYSVAAYAALLAWGGGKLAVGTDSDTSVWLPGLFTAALYVLLAFALWRTVNLCRFIIRCRAFLQCAYEDGDGGQCLFERCYTECEKSGASAETDGRPNDELKGMLYLFTWLNVAAFVLCVMLWRRREGSIVAPFPDVVGLVAFVGSVVYLLYRWRSMGRLVTNIYTTMRIAVGRYIRE